MDWGELFCGNVAHLFGSLVLNVDCKDDLGNPFVKKFDGITTIGLLLTLVVFLSFRVNIILGTLHIVLILMPVMLFLVRIANRTQGWFDHRLRADADAILSASIEAVKPDEAVQRALQSFRPGKGKTLLVARGRWLTLPSSVWARWTAAWWSQNTTMSRARFPA